jgi:hypothetical protein
MGWDVDSETHSHSQYNELPLSNERFERLKQKKFKMILDLENDLGIKSCSIQKLNLTLKKKTPF